MAPPLRNVRLFLLALACSALLWAGWECVQVWRVRTYGQAHTAVVARTWQESSHSFTYHRNGRPQLSYTRHAEVALLDSAQSTDHQQVTSHPLKPEGSTRREAALKRMDSLIGRIREAFETVPVPPDAPRYVLPPLPDDLADGLFPGKKVQVKRLDDQVLLTAQYASLLPAKAGVLLGLGVFLLGIAGGMTVFFRRKAT